MIHQDENNNDLCVDQKGWGLLGGGGSLHIHFLELVLNLDTILLGLSLLYLKYILQDYKCQIIFCDATDKNYVI